MGVMESRHIPLHTMCGYSPKSGCTHQQSEVNQSRFVVTRTDRISTTNGQLEGTCRVWGQFTGCFPSASNWFDTWGVHQSQVRAPKVYRKRMGPTTHATSGGKHIAQHTSTSVWFPQFPSSTTSSRVLTLSAFDEDIIYKLYHKHVS